MKEGPCSNTSATHPTLLDVEGGRLTSSQSSCRCCRLRLRRRCCCKRTCPGLRRCLSPALPSPAFRGLLRGCRSSSSLGLHGGSSTGEGAEDREGLARAGRGEQRCPPQPARCLPMFSFILLIHSENTWLFAFPAFFPVSTLPPDPRLLRPRMLLVKAASLSLFLAASATSMHLAPRRRPKSSSTARCVALRPIAAACRFRLSNKVVVHDETRGEHWDCPLPCCELFSACVHNHFPVEIPSCSFSRSLSEPEYSSQYSHPDLCPTYSQHQQPQAPCSTFQEAGRAGQHCSLSGSAAGCCSMLETTWLMQRNILITAPSS